MQQEIMKTKEEAIALAKKWLNEEGRQYVCVIESRGEFFIEDEPELLRNWEKRIWVGYR